MKYLRILLFFGLIAASAALAQSADKCDDAVERSSSENGFVTLDATAGHEDTAIPSGNSMLMVSNAQSEELKQLEKAKEELHELKGVLSKSGCAGAGGDLINSIWNEIDAYIKMRNNQVKNR